eukprot:1702028-Pleurochrysis_carterae.AAC.1
MVRAAASVPGGMPFSIRPLRSLKALVIDVHPSPMRVVIIVATQPVFEGGIGNVDHEDVKGVLVAGLNELLHARLLVNRSGHLLVVELLGMLTSYSSMELVVEKDGVQLVLVEVQNVLE